MTRPPRRSGRPHAEPLRTLDEKFVSNAIVYEVARPTGSMIVDGTPYRRADGSLDRDLVYSAWEEFIRKSPSVRQRLARAPLGLFTPSWVSVDEIDVRDHVRFHPGVVEWDPRHVELLTGAFNGPMDPKGPLWDILVVELSTGQLGFAVRIHHALGDGMFGLLLIQAFSSDAPVEFEPYTRAPMRFPEDPRAPRGPLSLTLAARRQIASGHDSLAEEWAEWKRKPLKKRITRVGGRNIRSLRDAYIRRSGMLERSIKPRDAAILTVDLPTAKSAARAAGGSVADLTVALALHAFAALHPERTEIATLVPVSPRREKNAVKRNHVSMVRVAVPVSLGIAETVASVRAQVQSAVDSGESGITRGVKDWLGYASYLPVFLRRRWFGTAEMDSMTLWPVTEPDDEAAVFASSFLKRLDIAISIRSDLDTTLFLDSITESLAEIGAPVIDPLSRRAGAAASADQDSDDDHNSDDDQNGTTR
ncbi:wax ester/triacylglycerol synthase domain-containing protein [Rathayibacter sp. VKM Ac-2754]|uniref:wax ester/triacylglycerol synthase domain-containing protein n=1 Tax=Rathayibacter sp. VKM Ac-2754 TaxID=2609251 RepID=UPI00135A7115|nr:wax ester/triacylglycerol synthase domain-containing protein [Rathayibacter sp. VKM Ac-2754]MWV59052.1 hypothetical protein [Rathayibacter sp. VKM Ac-2754]